MSTLKERLFTNWHLMRIMRLGIGIMMLVMGIQGKDWALGLFSTFFLYQAITDTGCCGTQACSTPKERSKINAAGNAEEVPVEYEEIK